MKLCLIAPYPPPYGGIGNWVLLIERYIKSNDTGVDLSIISTAPVKRSTDGRTLWDRVIGSGLDMLEKRKELKKQIKLDKPDVIHITTSGQLAVIRDILLIRLAHRHRIPTVYHIRFGRIPEISGKNTLEWKLISYAMRLTDVTIAIDNTTYQAIKEKLTQCNVLCIPNPIDISSIPLANSNGNKTVMFLGWVVPTKGVEELLGAWRQIRQKHDDWTLRIVGPNKRGYYEELKSKFRFDGVEFSGEKKHDDAMKLLNDAQIFILPSYTEGFPNVVVEAMALSKPVVATRVGAIPDILSGGCGVLISPANMEEIVDALDNLMLDSNLRKELAQKAYRKLTDEYVVERVFERYRECWASLKENKE